MMYRLYSTPTFVRRVFLIAWILQAIGTENFLKNKAYGEPPPEIVRIGLSGSLFRGTPETLVQSALPPFRVLIRSQTGMECDVVPVADPAELAERLATGR